MIVLIVLGIILVLVLLWYVSTFNSIKVARLKVSEALSGIDIALTKRFDTLTKMLDVVKGYQQHEITTLREIVSLRKNMSMSERKDANAKMDQAMSQINVVAENYPELRSSENFVTLQKSIADVEEHLQAARRLYNSNVTAYNAKIVMIPNSIVANQMGATPAEFFEAEAPKREDVSMTF
ncbi:MAG: LemA family protein [Eubacteriales bacterium]|nr:LemA family protein [Lachnospiraceae bacterium]MDO5127444.1 LemA family protein [Eubacteriales bacterium]